MWVSLVAQRVKHLPTMRETQVRSLGWEDLLEKEMATHSSTLAWRIPRTEDPGRLQSMGSQRVGHDWATSLPFHFQASRGFSWWLRQERICLQYRRSGFDPWVGKILWNRKWHPTPVSLPGKFHGQRSLVGYSPWGPQKVRHNWTHTHLLFQMNFNLFSTADKVQ